MPEFKWTAEIEPARAATEGVPAAGPIYRCRAEPEGRPTLKDVTTCFELFQRSVRLYGPRPCLGHRAVVGGQAQPYTYITYQEAGAAVDQIGSAMTSVGVGANTRVGVFGSNSPEWMITQQV